MEAGDGRWRKMLAELKRQRAVINSDIKRNGRRYITARPA